MRQAFLTAAFALTATVAIHAFPFHKILSGTIGDLPVEFVLIQIGDYGLTGYYYAANDPDNPRHLQGSHDPTVRRLYLSVYDDKGAQVEEIDGEIWENSITGYVYPYPRTGVSDAYEIDATDRTWDGDPRAETLLEIETYFAAYSASLLEGDPAAHVALYADPTRFLSEKKLDRAALTKIANGFFEKYTTLAHRFDLLAWERFENGKIDAFVAETHETRETATGTTAYETTYKWFVLAPSEGGLLAERQAFYIPNPEGEWTGGGDGDLTITNYTDETFDFRVEAYWYNHLNDNVHMGEIEGTAHRSGARFVFASEEDEECALAFIVGPSVIHVEQTGLCPFYAGMNVRFDGTFTPAMDR
jgi:hypothetical protein